MLKDFKSWPDVLAHVRSGGNIYYIPNESLGPCRMIARVRTTENSDARIWLRSPEYLAYVFPSMIADETFLDKLYRWDPRKAVTITKE